MFDDNDYLKAMGAGDVWVAVGWSSDIIPYSKRASNISVFAPASGTSLWADLWVRPLKSQNIFKGTSKFISEISLKLKL